MSTKIIATKVTLKNQHEETTIRKENGRLTIAQNKQSSISEILILAQKEKRKCYLLCYNDFDKRSFSKEEIIANLVTAGFVSDSRIEQVLSHALLFLSEHNLLPVQKFIHNTFPKLNFVLVRVNRSNFPKLRYNK